MSLIGKALATLFHTNTKETYTKISDFIQLEDKVESFIYYNNTGQYMTPLDLKTSISENYKIPFSLELDKLLEVHIDNNCQLQVVYVNQGKLVRTFIMVFSNYNDTKQHKELISQIKELFLKYKGEVGLVRDDYFKNYLKYIIDPSIEKNDMKSEASYEKLLDKKDFDLENNYIKIGSMLFSLMNVSVNQKWTGFNELTEDLKGIEYQISYRLDKTYTPKEVVNTALNHLTDDKIGLSTSVCSSNIFIKVWGKNEKELFSNINKVSCCFQRHGKTLYIYNTDMFEAFINSVPALQSKQIGVNKIDSINSVVYEYPFFE